MSSIYDNNSLLNSGKWVLRSHYVVNQANERGYLSLLTSGNPSYSLKLQISPHQNVHGDREDFINPVQDRHRQETERKCCQRAQPDRNRCWTR